MKGSTLRLSLFKITLGKLIYESYKIVLHDHIVILFNSIIQL